MADCLLAIVGLSGSGKSTAVEYFVKRGFQHIYFGELVIERLKEKKLPICEENERKERELIRFEHSMAGFAKLNLPKINGALKLGDVVIDGLYSWEEYLFLKEYFPEMLVVALYAPPKLRYQRLANRPIRPLTTEESHSRDCSQIENLHQAGPIAVADYLVKNIKGRSFLMKQLEEVLNEIKKS